MNKKTLKILSMSLCMVLFAAMALGSGSNDNNSTSTGTANSATQAESDAITDLVDNEITSNNIVGQTGNVTESVDNISTTTDFENMSVKDISNCDGVYVGLSKVRQMDSLPCSAGSNAEVASGNKVFVAFFDLFNSTDALESLSSSEFSCYADGVQMNDVDVTYKPLVDGIVKESSYELDGGTQAFVCVDYEVPESWNEIKLFYGEDYVWTVTSNDLSTKKFNQKSMYKVDNSRTPTKEGEIIYKDKYELIYKGYEKYTHSNKFFGDKDYVVFKFTINNTSSETLDYSLVGYKMRGYLNNYSLGDATYTMDDKIGEFNNVYNVDDVKKGMTSNVYVAFEITDDATGPLYMVYDAGYISSEILGSVYVNR